MMTPNPIWCHREAQECPNRPSASSDLPSSTGDISFTCLTRAAAPHPIRCPTLYRLSHVKTGVRTHFRTSVRSSEERAHGQVRPFDIRVRWCLFVDALPIPVLRATRGFPHFSASQASRPVSLEVVLKITSSWPQRGSQNYTHPAVPRCTACPTLKRESIRIFAPWCVQRRRFSARTGPAYRYSYSLMSIRGCPIRTEWRIVQPARSACPRGQFLLRVRLMKKFLVSAFALLATVSAIRAAEMEEGFKPLMDGKSFDGWKIAEPNSHSWRVEDGCFVANGNRSHLFYVGDEKPFKDF